jgi:hypothetical protein
MTGPLVLLVWQWKVSAAMDGTNHGDQCDLPRSCIVRIRASRRVADEGLLEKRCCCRYNLITAKYFQNKSPAVTDSRTPRAGRIVRPGNKLDAAECSQQRSQGVTLTADGYLVLPCFILSTFTAGATEEPAQVACLKFPGRAFFFAAAFFQGPAILTSATTASPLIDQEKIKLPFDMDGYGSPPLLVTLHGLQGNPKQHCKGFLRFSQFCP